MSFISQIKSLVGLSESASLALPENARLKEQVQGVELQNELLLERMAELELALEDSDWTKMSLEGDREFSREGLRKITQIARLMYLKNPLINRAVSVQQFYVWAQGCSIGSEREEINSVIQSFWADPRNKKALTSHQARTGLEADLQVEANIFFVFFVNKSDGRIQVRTVPFDEVQEIVTNPGDSKEAWFYKRTWQECSINQATGQTESESKTEYYPDLSYRTSGARSIGRFGGIPVNWDTPIYHVKTGGLSCMKFGVSEIYASIDWARAYNKFLEDWATITRAHARFAWNLAVPGGRNAIAAAKTKLGSTLGGSSLLGSESNPPPVAGSTWIGDPSVKMEPIKTAGATGKAEDGRRLLLMVAAATGWPETFFGDASVGSLATAQSLDRPTELRIKDRQALWSDVLQTILNYVVFWAVAAPSGPLRTIGTIEKDEEGIRVAWRPDPETGMPIDPAINIEFPSILEKDTSKTISAIVSGATLDGKQLAGTMARETVSRMIHVALGSKDAAAETAKAMDEEPVQGEIPKELSKEDPEEDPSSLVAEAIGAFRKELEQIQP